MAEYFSYLLRIWNQESGTEQEWRATLESTATHQVYCFNNMKSMTAFLSGNPGRECEMENREINVPRNQACVENTDIGAGGNKGKALV